MPYSYDIDVEKRLINVTVTGVISAQEILAFRDEISKDPKLGPGFSQLTDFSAATKIDADPASVRQLASWTFHREPTRMAVVAHKPEIFGMIRMFEGYKNLAGVPDEIHIFDTREAALAWLEGPRVARQ